MLREIYLVSKETNSEYMPAKGDTVTFDTKIDLPAKTAETIKGFNC